MLIARAPVRISFAGGGTDIDAYYARFGGLVVSATIDKYFYLFINATDASGVQVMSSYYRTFSRYINGQGFWDEELPLPKAVLDFFGVRRGISMSLASEIPPGTGLGSSSAATVALVKGISTALGYMLTKEEVAETACEIEIKRLGMPIGKQDQYASAAGGVNTIEFTPSGVSVEPLCCPDDTLEQLEKNLLLFFTGSARNSAIILDQQRQASLSSDPQVIESLHAIKDTAIQAKDALEHGDLSRFGAVLHETWKYKKRLACGISNDYIDECYELALHHGAIGGKITGAGGGGFLMLYCPEDYQDRVTWVLEQKGLKCLSARFEYTGARVLMNSGLRIGVAK